jgi:hypothetical protein
MKLYLTSIFLPSFQSGGVHFGSGGLKQDGDVVGQRSAEDTLFLEAEKWGFDVRMDDNKAAATEGGSGAQMSFNFFGGGDDFAAASSGAAHPAPLDTSSTHNLSAATNALSPAPIQPIDLPVFAPVAVGILADDAPRIAPLSMADILAEALKFRRQM